MAKYKGDKSKNFGLIPWNDLPTIKAYKNDLDQDKLVTIEASCVTGFENAAKDEIVQTFQGISEPTVHQGRVLFDVDMKEMPNVLKLRTIDNVMSVIGASTEVEFNGTTEENLEKLNKFALTSLNWKNGISSWNRVFDFYKEENLLSEALKNDDNCAINKEEEGEENKSKKIKTEQVPSFRCTCYRTGENVHNFGSMDVAKSVGGVVQEKFGWKVKMKDYDLEFVINVDINQVYCGIMLTNKSLFKRNIEHFGPTTLRATICASLLNLAAIKPGDVVVDPMCGGGSIPIEGFLAYKQGFHIGGDYHEKAIERCAGNFAHHNRSHPGDFVRWDVTNIPLKDNSVDVLVSDLPFGKRSGSKADNRVLYPKTLLAMARVVRPKTGRAVLLTQDKTSMFKSAGKFNKFWKINRQMYCNIGGLAALVFLMTRTEAVP